MPQVIIGTAGHIDHGKTSLVKALTGVDTDRLPEEKARGMTIDLGFAFLNDSITIIDVPGHEKFIRNMVAGVATVNIALLAVAADDGIMPQTREHLHILQLLHIPDCVVALTKTDLVNDNEWLDLVELEIRELTEKIFGKVDVVRTSIQTNEGIAELKQLLLSKANRVQQSADRGYFRLQVDRVFTMAGFGTIATGTVVSGTLKKGDEIEIIPGNVITKVRGLQSHGKETDQVRLGDRAAVNLANVEVEKLYRGIELVTPGKMKAISKFAGFIQLTDEWKQELKHGQRVRVHIGTAEVMARVGCIRSKKISPGKSGNVIIDLEQPVSIATNDRFVIRSFSPMNTIGGGMVLITDFPEKVKLQQWLPGLELPLPKRFKQLVTVFKKNPKKVYEWSKILNMTENQVRKMIFDPDLKVSKRSFVYSLENLKDDTEKLFKLLKNYHEQFPLREGMSMELIKQETGFRDQWQEEILNMLIEQGQIKKISQGVALSTHAVRLSEGKGGLSQQIEKTLIENHFVPLTTTEISTLLNESPKEMLEILHVFKNREEVVELENGLWMHSRNMTKLRDKMRVFFQQKKELNVADFKDMSGLTRKHAIPVLEYCDKQGWTERNENVRLKGENL